MPSHVTITTQTNGTITLTLDGHDLSSSITHALLDLDAGTRPVLELTLDLDHLTARLDDVPTVAHIPTGLAATLTALGCTPPR